MEAGRTVYGGITLSVALWTAVPHLFGMTFDLVNIALIYLLPVLFGAMYGGIRPGVYAAVISVLAFDFFFVPPAFSFTVEDLRYLISFAVYLAAAVLTASLAARLKQQLKYAKHKEAQTATLYAISRELSAITDIPTLLENVSRHVALLMGTEAVVYLPDEKRDLQIAARTSTNSAWGGGDSERAVAQLAFRHGEAAGRGTGTLRESAGYYVPFRTDDRVFGVMAVRLDGSGAAFPVESQRLIDALGDLAASGIARVTWAEEAKIAHLTAESEKLRAALLDSVSHELRTPLAAIIGSVTGLIEGERLFGPEERRELLANIRDGALRMNRLVANLLGMVQLESGMLRLRRQWCDVEDIIGVALAQVKDFQQHRRIIVKLPDEVPMIPGDEVLLEQVLVNVVSNAIKYSPDRSEIVISVRMVPGTMTIAVSDRGVGVAVSDVERIFDKFYRADAARHVPGTGLGLAICKGIVELHGGTIAAEPNEGQGTIVRITLPYDEFGSSNPRPQEGEE